MDSGKKGLGSTAVYLILIILVSFGVYSNTLGNGFVYDDHFQIENNPWIKDLTHFRDIFTSHVYGFKKELNTTNSYRPLLLVYYAFEYAVFGLKPWGWHLVNIIFHTLNSLLVFFIASRILGKKGGEGPVYNFAPFFAAVIFAAHPVHSEAIAWVGCVTELSYTFFYLSAFYLFISCNGIGVLATAAFFFLLALLSKETAITLPLVLLAYDLFSGERRFRIGELIKRYAPFVVSLFVYIALRLTALKGVLPNQGLHTYLDQTKVLINSAVFLAEYIKAIILPIKFYPFNLFDPVYSIAEPKAILSFVFLILVAIGIIALWLYRKRVNPFYLVFALLFLITMLPALYIPGLSRHAFADRQAYLPSVWLILIVSLLVDKAGKGKNAVKAVSAVLIVITALYSFETIRRNSAWNNDLTIWQASAEASDANYLAYLNIGIEYSILGNTDDAIAYYRKSLEANLKRCDPDKPKVVVTHLNIAKAYRSKGDLEAARAEFKEALKAEPANLGALLGLASVSEEMGLFDEAVSIYRQGLNSTQDPQAVKDINNAVGNSYARRGMFSEALASYEDALKMSPDDEVILSNMAQVRSLAGKR